MVDMPLSALRISRRRFLATSGAASVSVVTGLQPEPLYSQVFTPAETSGSRWESRTVKKDVIEFGFVLKELHGPGAAKQPVNGGFLVQEAEPVGWLAKADWAGWKNLKTTESERKRGVAGNKVHTTQKTFQSRGFTFWTADPNFQLPAAEAAIMAMAAPAGSIATGKSPTGAASADLKIKEGQANPWSSNWYAGAKRDPRNQPVAPEVKYEGVSHDGGAVGGKIGCTAKWIGAGWGWQGSHASNGAPVKGTFNIPLQWKFVVVSRRRVDTKEEQRPNSTAPWADVPNSLKQGVWGPWTESKDK